MLPLNEELPDAKSPDYGHWMKLSFWHREEASALVLGLDPHWPGLALLRAPNYLTPLGVRFRDTYEMLTRAQRANELSMHPNPMEIVTWSHGRIELPSAFLTAFEASPSKKLAAEPKLSSHPKRITKLYDLAYAYAKKFEYPDNKSWVSQAVTFLQTMGAGMDPKTFRDIIADAEARRRGEPIDDAN